MSYYLKTLLSEQEKRRILGLHQDRRKQEFRGLFSEAIEEKTKSFFEILKTTLPGFPKDGYVYEADIDGKPTTVWEVLVDKTNDLKYYLLPDGTAVDSTGQKSTNKWYKTLPQAAADILNSTGTEGATGTNTLEPGKKLSGQEMGNLLKTLDQEAKAKAKAQKQLNKDTKESCKRTFNDYVKYYGDENKKLALLSTSAGAQSYQAYKIEHETCCTVFTQAKTGFGGAFDGLPSLEKVKAQGFCSTVPTGTQGSVTTTTTTVKTPQGGTTKSREDQEMIDQGLGQ